MKAIGAILFNTFRETVRDKLLYGIVFFAISFIFVTLLLGEMSLHEERRVIVDIGLADISIVGLIIAIFLGVGMLHKEIDKKTLYSILSKPVHRYQFIIGKYLGINFTIFIQVLIMTVVFTTVLLLKGESPDAPIFISIYLVEIELLVVSAIAILFSSFSTPFVSGVLTFGVFVVGRNMDLLEAFIRKGEIGFARRILSFSSYVFPNLYLFYPSGKAVGEGWVSVHQSFVETTYLIKVTSYGLLYCALCVLLAIAIFQRRDLI